MTRDFFKSYPPEEMIETRSDFKFRAYDYAPAGTEKIKGTFDDS